MTWSITDLQKLKEAGKIKGFKESVARKQKPKQPKIQKKEPKALAAIKKSLCDAGIAFETEYHFHHERKFRFDIAIPEKRIAIEFEGIISAKSRHTSVTGYTRDATKYNLAQSLGWKVYRYTVLNYLDFERDLKKLV